MNDLSKAARAVLVQVGDESDAQRIDNFLLRRLKGVPKSHVYRVLRSGQVRVNSGRVGPDYRLRPGDKVRVPPVRMRQASAAAASRVVKPIVPPIVYEDEALLVMDKPAGLAVHGGSGVSQGAIEALRAARPEAKSLELAHRLDRDTSGLLVIAKQRRALIALHRMLREGELDKRYIAIAKGAWRGGARDLRDPLHKYVTASGERRVSVQEGGMEARTRVRPLARCEHYSLLELRLLTGRTHQIRVHLANAGHPVLGDDKYGDFELNRLIAKQGIKRMLLHAHRLEFRHPLGGAILKLEAPLPADMAGFAREQFPAAHLWHA